MKTGIYQHYKGKRYEVLGTAYHSETEDELVIYKTLYPTAEKPEGTWWARPKRMFEEQVETTEGPQARFAWIGPVL